MLDQLMTGFSILEAGVTHFEKSRPAVLAYNSKIKTLWLAVHAVAMRQCLVELNEVLRGRYAFARVFRRTFSSTQTAFKCELAVQCLVVVGIAVGTYFYFKRGLGKEIQLDGEVKKIFDDKEIKVLSGRPLIHQLTQAGLVASAVLHFVMAFFTQRKLLHIVMGVSQLYSCYALGQQKWLSYQATYTRGGTGDRSFSLNNPRSKLSKVDLNFLFPILKTSSPVSGNCGVCQDEGPDIYVCSEGHALHARCIPGIIYTVGEGKLLNNATFERKEKVSNGQVSYTIGIFKDHFPTCPECRAFPLAFSISTIAYDDDKARLTWTVYKTGEGLIRKIYDDMTSFLAI